MARIVLYQAIALVAIVPLGNASQAGAWQPHNPVVFAKQFPIADQQFTTAPEPQRFLPEFGWNGQQLETRFAKPFPVTEQQFLTLGPERVPSALDARGWQSYQFDYRFTKPFPITEQPYTTAPEPEQFLPGYGWNGYQLDYKFATPFPVTSQIFSVWDLVGDVPPYRPPGAGKRYHKPTDYLPEPAWDAKPNKPFRPVWDKPRGGEIEVHPQPAQAPGPAPLPPASLFGASPTDVGGVNLAALPNFNQYVPPDPLGLGNRLRDAQDETDAIAVLKALGLL